MAHFALLHGMTHGPASWHWLQQILQGLGHTTTAVSVPLDDPGMGLQAITDVVLEQLSPCDNPVVFVGHSSGGYILPLIAQRRPTAGMVFLASGLPIPGQSVIGQIQADPTMFRPDWLGQDPADEATARRFLYHDVPEPLVTAVLADRIQGMPQQALIEVFPTDAWPDVPTWSIIARDDRTIDPLWLEAQWRKRFPGDPGFMPTGHCPHLAQPRALASTLHAWVAAQVPIQATSTR